MKIMKKLIIKKFGPIASVDISLSRINLIIGPQSSGKSCILKIASFCDWAEKTIELSQDEKTVLNRESIEKHLLVFHDLQGYISEDSFFSYDTNTMYFSFSFRTNSYTFEWKDGRWDFKRAKIAYIIAERNVLSVIPNWYDMDLPNNSLRSFLKEWQNARNNTNENNVFPILNLGVNYNYDRQNATDIINLENGKKMSLQNVSSGIQSLIPLLILMHYMTNYIFRNDVESIRDHDINMNLLYSMKAYHPMRDNIFFDRDGIDLDGRELSETIDNYKNYQFCDIFIEEPEENLFPETQRDLVNWLAEIVNGERKHSLFIATHSPYIMSAFNNLIQAGDIIEESPEKVAEVEKIIGGHRAIKYDDVAAFAIADGSVHSIKDDELRLISPSELDSVSEDIAHVFNQLIEL